jgi:hypothetical protein
MPPRVEKRLVRHSDRTNYVVWVLWIIGMSERGISEATGKRKKQISGIVNRSPYPNRSAMTDKERQAALDELLLVRIGEDGKPIDGGILDRVPHKIIPLRGKQVKRSG